MGAYYGLNTPVSIIPENADLDDYVKPGQYRTLSATVNATISNTPYTASGFKLIVERVSNDGRLMQTIKASNNIVCYYRTCASTDGVYKWASWCKIITDNHIQCGRTSGIACPAGEITDYEVTFPRAFTATPRVCATFYSGTVSARYGYITIMVFDVTKTKFTVRIANAHTERFTPAVDWIATIG